MENKEEEPLLSELPFDEEEKRVQAANRKKELKVILITFAIILTGFVTFCYFFFKNMEEKKVEYNQQQQEETEKEKENKNALK